MIRKILSFTLPCLILALVFAASIPSTEKQNTETQISSNFIEQTYAQGEEGNTRAEQPTIPKPINVPGTTSKEAGALSYFRSFLTSIAKTVIGLLAFFAIFFIVYSGFLYITARGDQNQIDKAKKVVIYAVIGLLVAAFSYAIVRTVVEVPIKVSQEVS